MNLSRPLLCAIVLLGLVALVACGIQAQDAQPKEAPATATMSESEAVWAEHVTYNFPGDPRTEVVLFDSTRVDVLTAEWAIEVDWVRNRHGHLKWYEAFGQALHYARVTRRHPMVLLLSRDPSADAKEIHAAIGAGDYGGVPVAIYSCPTNTWLVPPPFRVPVATKPPRYIGEQCSPCPGSGCRRSPPSQDERK